MVAWGKRRQQQTETPSESNPDGVVVLRACGSERRIVVRWPGLRLWRGQAVAGAIGVEAMNLAAVMGLEELKEVVEEVENLDNRFIAERGQVNLDGSGIRSHSGHLGDQRPVAARREAGRWGGAKTSR